MNFSYALQSRSFFASWRIFHACWTSWVSKSIKAKKIMFKQLILIYSSMSNSIYIYVVKHVSDLFFRQNFLTDRRIISVIAQFLFTVIMILLFFIWHMLINDLKKIISWIVMINKWSESKESILVNYIDDLKIILI